MTVKLMPLFIIFVAIICVSLYKSSTFVPKTVSSTIYQDKLHAPDFTALTYSGSGVTLSELKPKWIILNFWATWCVPCHEELPALQSIANDHSDTVLLIGINQNEDTALIQQFVTKYKVSFPIIIHPDESILKNYKVQMNPQTVLIDPHGRIVWRRFGPISIKAFGKILASEIEKFSVANKTILKID